MQLCCSKSLLKTPLITWKYLTKKILFGYGNFRKVGAQKNPLRLRAWHNNTTASQRPGDWFFIGCSCECFPQIHSRASQMHKHQLGVIHSLKVWSEQNFYLHHRNNIQSEWHEGGNKDRNISYSPVALSFPLLVRHKFVRILTKTENNWQKMQMCKLPHFKAGGKNMMRFE